MIYPVRDREMKCFIVLPCYNEEGNVKPLISIIDSTLRQRLSYEIIAVNDGSNDDTGELLRKLSRKYPIHILEHIRNKGIATALQIGLSQAIKRSSDEDLIFTMDSDNTHDPRYVLDMAKAAKKADIVIGSRYVKNGKQLNVPLHRVILSKAVNFLARRMVKLPVRDATSGYRCFKAAALKKLSMVSKHGFIESKGFEVSLEVLARTFWCNSTIEEVPITLDYSKKKSKSNVRLFPTMKSYFILLGKMKAWRRELEVNH